MKSPFIKILRYILSLGLQPPVDPELRLEIGTQRRLGPSRRPVRLTTSSSPPRLVTYSIRPHLVKMISFASFPVSLQDETQQLTRHHPDVEDDIDMDEDWEEGSPRLTSPGEPLTSSQAFMR